MTRARWFTAALLAATLSVAGCDQQGRPIEHPGLDRLKPGVSGEADVRGVFGVPETIIQGRDGTRTLQYPLGPQGPRTFFAVIGPDGKLIEVWNVLVPETFARITPGMTRDEVRVLLGRPGSEQSYPLKRQTAWEWKYIGEMHRDHVFFVMFDETGRVVSTGSEDPSLSSGS
ncbi:MAG: outer membrane protein assembly factor BamE [Burkholderiales bacterium]|jgi:outer membrane protein assembly factor BamE (lipoprotein component of BamABCDE complex)|nr:outer membrane protein assembly factor BamE [Burkholderiales bacterium]